MEVVDVHIENPLQIHDVCNKKRCQTSGRPRKNKQIIFSTPPKSIVSLILSKEIKTKSENCNIETNKLHNFRALHKEWVCRRCSGYRTFDQDSYKQHMILHKNQLHYCTYPNCSYSTKSSSNLIKHKRTHTSEKPYICDQCVFRTNFQNSLTVHKRIHTSERPYACQYCQYRCNSSSNLKKHLAHKHDKKGK